MNARKNPVTVVALLLAGLTLGALAQSAQAQCYYVPRPVYVAPRPVYVAPPAVYVAPRPVYVAPRPVYVTPPAVRRYPAGAYYRCAAPLPYGGCGNSFSFNFQYDD